jgi:hypothetical protein
MRGGALRLWFYFTMSGGLGVDSRVVMEMEYGRKKWIADSDRTFTTLPSFSNLCTCINSIKWSYINYS